jgi:hypothetical protein
MKVVAILLGVMLFFGVIAAVIDLDQSADAAKAKKKSPRHSHANNRGNQVCGDQLCSGSPFVKSIR